MKAIIRLSEYLYGLFVRFYPGRYRNEFGEEMKYVYSKSINEAYSEQGEPGIAKFWARTLTDGMKSLLIEHIENKGGGEKMKKNNGDLILTNKIFSYLAVGTAAILSIPLVAMQFTREVNWTAGDFVVMGTLIFGMGSMFIWSARRVNKKNRLVVGLIILAAFLAIWVHLAVGIVDSWPFAGS